MHAVSPHPEPDRLRQFGLGLLNPPETDVVEEHVAECPDCAATIHQFGDDTLLTLLRGLDRRTSFEPAPGPSASSPSEVAHQATLPPSTESPSLMVLAQVDAACLEYERYWQRGLAPRLEDHLGRVAEPYRAILFQELLRLDRRYGEENGSAPALGDYLQRLPQYENQLRRFFSPRDNPPANLAPFPGHPRYRIIRVIGNGGMGTVYEAEHLHMERTVALKVIRAEFLKNPSLQQRFRLEVKAVARLAHPNIVQAFDADQVGDLHFLAMEYVEGEHLGEYLKMHGRLPSAEACRYAHQAALALQHAHERGMTHRDIKPHNLMRTPAGQVKVLDFGLALLTDDPAHESSRVTSTGTAMGTADYIAPEQALDSRQADIRSDIYSLGCTLYHLLTGQPPFPQGSAIQKMLKHSLDQPASLKTLRPDVAPALVDVVEKMMAKDPTTRFQTPAEVAAALAPFIEVAPCNTPAATADPANAETMPLLELAVDARPAPQRRRRKLWPVLAVALAACVALGIGIAARNGVFQVDTPHGLFTIKTSDPDIEITATKNGEILAITDTKTKQKWSLDTKNLRLSMADQPGGLTIELDGKKPLVLKRDGKETVTVSWLSPTAKGLATPKIKVLHRIPIPAGQEAWHTSVAPEGKLFLACFGCKVHVWDGVTGKKQHEFACQLAALTPNGKMFVRGGNVQHWELPSTIQVHDAKTAKILHSFDLPRGMWGLVMSPDSRHFLHWGPSNTVHLANLETGETVKSWSHDRDTLGLAFTRDGKFLFLRTKPKSPFVVWDVENNKESKEFAELAKFPAIRFGDQQIQVEVGKKSYFADIKGQKKLGPLPLLPEKGAVAAGRGNDGVANRLLGYANGELSVFDVETGKEKASFQLPDHERFIRDWTIFLTPDSRFACVASDRSVYLLDLTEVFGASP